MDDQNPDAGSGKEAGPAEKYLIFTVGNKKYAVPSKLIGEVSALEKVFPLPLVSGYIQGIINRYSIPYALIDLDALLRDDREPRSGPVGLAKIIVLKESVDKLALLIDDVTDIADIPGEDLLKIEQDGEGPEGLIQASFEWKEDHILCLEIPKLIDAIKQGTIKNEFETYTP
ncbi:MAG: chemotaxis protein CheW [Spirochaetaceae bacterium]|nr:chemotaxis protein CheW [Spirochaetaceae bacterium]